MPTEKSSENKIKFASDESLTQILSLLPASVGDSSTRASHEKDFASHSLLNKVLLLRE